MRLIKKISKKELKKVLNPHLFKIMDFKENYYDFFECAPEEILNHKRFDIMAKYIYAKYRLQNTENEWAKTLYKELLRPMNFHEKDNSGKDSFEKFIASFNKTIKSINQNGFDPNQSVIPIGNDNTIIDGSHRVGAALACNKKIYVVKIDKKTNSYNYQRYKKTFIKEKFLDIMATEYCKIKKNTHTSIIFPIAEGKIKEIKNIISNYGRICYEKDIYLNRNGIHNIVTQMYKYEHWINKSSNVMHHSVNRFIPNKPIKILLIESKDMQKMKKAKEEVRNLFNLGNYPIHISDYHEETERISEKAFNENSIHFLNNSTNKNNKNFTKLFGKYKQWIKENNYNKDEFAIDASSVLSVYGLREANDLDYLSLKNYQSNIEKIDNHNLELKFHKHSISKLINDPDQHFYYDGFKFISLENIIKMKKKRGETKDKMDLLLIKKIKSKKRNLFYIKHYIQFRLGSAKKNMKNAIIRKMPKNLYPYAKKTYYFIKKIKNVPEIVGPINKEIEYKGYKVSYHKGTSIINRIKNGETYEKRITDAINKSIHNTQSDYFLDIGANIGLISLNILKQTPNIKIFAFEPGHNQNSFFQKTIENNNLNPKIELSKSALGDKKEKKEFQVHKPADSSGDGFVDTKRAGKTNTINVDTTTIDEWWKNQKKPKIKIVKLDTEGSELWILRGAKKYIETCKPRIFIEIHHKNLKNYSHNHKDILEFFHEIKYDLYTLNNIKITKENIDTYINTEQDYYACPK